MENELDKFDIFKKSSMSRHPIGVVVGGSLSKGVDVKLAFDDVEHGVQAGSIIEGMAVGKYVVIEGKSGKKFFSIVTDIALDSNNPDLAKTPPDFGDHFVADVYGSSIAFGRLQIAPMLLLEGDDAQAKPKPVKTVPAHFSQVFEATAADVQRVFPEGEKRFYIGTPLDMEHVKVNLNLKDFVERSSGVFGKSGTGKSFITRTILAGVIKANVASCLIFDMHNDYGWEIRNERQEVYQGLRQIFNTNQVQVITLDVQTSQHRNSRYDGTLEIGLDSIEPEDVEMIADLIDLSETQKGALHYLRRKYKREWIIKLLDEGDEDLAKSEEEGKVQKGTLRAMQRKLEIFRPERMGFLRPTALDKIGDIFNLLDRGTSVVLEFGVYGDMLEAYVFVANYITRRLHRLYVGKKNKAAGRKAEEPRQLVITIEEAHKFLDPEIAKHTIFGNIARELRKYNVTLLLVDQRPSGIDTEVMSQIGTRVTCLLDNEEDVRAVFSGVSGASQLREVLARLDTQQQALILGHAVPIPVVIKVRDYKTMQSELAIDPVVARRQHSERKKAIDGNEES
jgi:DNA helicase HerA-like ATPase